MRLSESVPADLCPACAPCAGCSALPSSSTGLTLIELMVTLAVVAMLMAAVAPTLGVWITNQKVRNTATSIVSGLQYARSEAVRRNRPVTFWLVRSGSATRLDDNCAVASDSASWVVTLGTASPAGKCAQGTSSLQLKANLAPQDGGGGDAAVAVAAINADSGDSATRVTFNGFGQVTNTSPISRIDVTGTSEGVNKSWRVVVSGGGHSKLCDPAVTGTTDTRACGS